MFHSYEIFLPAETVGDFDLPVGLPSANNPGGSITLVVTTVGVGFLFTVVHNN